MRLPEFAFVNSVMFCDPAVHAEEDRLALAGKLGHSQRSFTPLDMHHRNVADFFHIFCLADLETV